METVAGLLRRRRSPVRPHVKSMIAMPRDNVEEGIFTGGDGEWLPQIFNVYLADAHDPGRVLQPFHEMTLLAQRDLLTLATLHCDWQKLEIQEMEIREMDQQAWETFRKQHPEAVSPMPKA